MDHYEILAPRSRAGFACRLEELRESLAQHLTREKQEGRTLEYAKVFLSDAQNQYQQLIESELYQDCLAHAATTIVEQPPLDGSKISLLAKTTTRSDDFIFQSIRLTEEETRAASSYVQTIMLFEKYLHSMQDRQVDMQTHLVRTWIYVADIDVNYAGVVKARNDIFRKYGLTVDTHFIASTGIGGYSQTRSAAVAMDFLTYPGIEETDKKYLQALDHLNPTHEYGVAFERGTCLTLPGKQVAFISGTASIDRHGHVLYLGDVERQTVRLLDNIEALLHDGGMTLHDVDYFIIYLRDPSDYPVINRYMAQRFPTLPRILVLGKVCRPEWLIEMECTATKPL
ncbi:MAG: translation initiation inhibitor [Prevotella sp.]|nr:translation initiation inhibitor [Prevotella sp.]